MFSMKPLVAFLGYFGSDFNKHSLVSALFMKILYKNAAFIIRERFLWINMKHLGWFNRLLVAPVAFLLILL